MSMKQDIHRWIDEMPEDAPFLAELHERARLDLAISRARQSLAEGRGIPIDEVIERYEERCRSRLSA